MVVSFPNDSGGGVTWSCTDPSFDATLTSDIWWRYCGRFGDNSNASLRTSNPLGVPWGCCWEVLMLALDTSLPLLLPPPTVVGTPPVPPSLLLALELLWARCICCANGEGLGRNVIFVESSWMTWDTNPPAEDWAATTTPPWRWCWLKLELLGEVVGREDVVTAVSVWFGAVTWFESKLIKVF